MLKKLIFINFNFLKLWDKIKSYWLLGLEGEGVGLSISEDMAQVLRVAFFMRWLLKYISFNSSGGARSAAHKGRGDILFFIVIQSLLLGCHTQFTVPTSIDA